MLDTLYIHTCHSISSYFCVVFIDIWQVTSYRYYYYRCNLYATLIILDTIVWRVSWSVPFPVSDPPPSRLLSLYVMEWSSCIVNAMLNLLSIIYSNLLESHTFSVIAYFNSRPQILLGGVHSTPQIPPIKFLTKTMFFWDMLVQNGIPDASLFGAGTFDQFNIRGSIPYSSYWSKVKLGSSLSFENRPPGHQSWQRTYSGIILIIIKRIYFSRIPVSLP